MGVFTLGAWALLTPKRFDECEHVRLMLGPVHHPCLSLMDAQCGPAMHEPFFKTAVIKQGICTAVVD